MSGVPLDPPSLAHPFGADSLGRDVFVGVAFGARTSLIVAAIATAASLVLGILIGAPAGYFGGWVDRTLMQVCEIVQTLPVFLFAIILVAIFHPSVTSVVLAIAAVSWAPIARLVRSDILTLKEREFVHSAILAGHPRHIILLREILPNTLPTIVAYSAVLVANVILLEAGISFLGLSDPNVITWGYMIGASRSMVRLAWWTAVFPGLAIFLTVFSINLIAGGRPRPGEVRPIRKIHS
jgi:peptide/nickel transport system permease protein